MWKISVKTEKHSEIIDITSKVKQIVEASGIKSGLCTVYVPHTTAAIVVNENTDPSVKGDILQSLDKLVPWDDVYSHNEGNAAAHIKAAIIGSSKTFIVENMEIILGTWQGIFFCEFDGPRERIVYVEIIEQ